MRGTTSGVEVNLFFEAIDYKLATPFAISGHVFDVANTVRVSLSQAGSSGQGEGLGVFYLGDDTPSIVRQLQDVRSDIRHIKSVEEIQELLPPGGARNAVDCAFWDLRAKRECVGIWSLLDIPRQPLTTVFSLGIDEPERMARRAIDAKDYPFLKLKLDADHPVERVEAVRKARPDAMIITDVNQGWQLDELKEYAPKLQSLGVEMIEQPLRRGDDEGLADYQSPVPLGADESCLHTGEFEAAASRYDVINIKLDKTGGLTEALKLVGLARKNEKRLMVGNMLGTSLSMAPATVVGQLSDYVDIDGPLVLQQDIENGLQYTKGGCVSPPSPLLWG